MLVELACSTTLIPAYHPTLFQNIVPNKVDGSRTTVVFIVCGGFKVSLEELAEYRTIVDTELGNGTTWQILFDGKTLGIPKAHLDAQ